MQLQLGVVEMQDKQLLLGPGPSLSVAWDYFRTHTLPRRVPVAKLGSPDEQHASDTTATDRVQFRRAADHELSSELYPVLGTTLADLGQFGLGEGVVVGWVVWWMRREPKILNAATARVAQASGCISDSCCPLRHCALCTD